MLHKGGSHSLASEDGFDLPASSELSSDVPVAETLQRGITWLNNISHLLQQYFWKPSVRSNESRAPWTSLHYTRQATCEFLPQRCSSIAKQWPASSGQVRLAAVDGETDMAVTDMLVLFVLVS